MFIKIIINCYLFKGKAFLIVAIVLWPWILSISLVFIWCLIQTFLRNKDENSWRKTSFSFNFHIGAFPLQFLRCWEEIWKVTCREQLFLWLSVFSARFCQTYENEHKFKKFYQRKTKIIWFSNTCLILTMCLWLVPAIFSFCYMSSGPQVLLFLR